MIEQNANHQQRPLREPILIAAWPGAGFASVMAVGALIEQTGAEVVGSVPAGRHFDLAAARVEDGTVLPAQAPENHLYGWRNPGGGPDLLLFVGEAAPVYQKLEFCRTLLRVARGFGARRAYDLAAMVTPTDPRKAPQLLSVATTRELLDEVVSGAGEELATVKRGEVQGIDGTFLAAAALDGVEAAALVTEVPQIGAEAPYPKASVTLLRLLGSLTSLPVDASALEAGAAAREAELAELFERIQGIMGGAAPEPWAASDVSSVFDLEEEAEEAEAPPEKEALDPSVLAHIEGLFLEAERDRSRAAELKRALDLYGVFGRYEDRFLDLFSPR